VGGPAGFLLLPCPVFGLDKLTTYTSPGAGRYVGPGVPDDGNEGDLLPFLSGDPADDITLVLELLQTGTLYRGAEFGWRKSTDAADQVRGVHDERFFDCSHDPFNDDPVEAYGLGVVVSEAFKRLLIFRCSVANTVDVRYRALGATDPTVWSSTTIDLDRWTSVATTVLTAWELPDGAMRLLVNRGTGAAIDLDMYGSLDGGLTWTILSELLLTTWAGAGAGATYNLQSGVSGDFVRVVYVDAGTIETIVSSDRGATWKVLTGHPTVSTVLDNGDTDDHYGACTLVSSGYKNGLFILCYVTAAAPTTLRWAFARRDEDWADDSDHNLSVTSMMRLGSCRSAEYLWFFVARDDGAADSGWTLVRYPVDRPTSPDERVHSEMMNYAGTQHYVPGFIRAVDADGVCLVAALVDDTAGALESFGMSCAYLDQWTRHSLFRSTPNTSYDSALFTAAWSSNWGRPSASTYSPFTAQTSGTGTSEWTPDRTKLVSPSGYIRYLYDDGPTPTDLWGDASAFTGLLYVATGGSTLQEQCGLRIVGHRTGGAMVDLTMRLESAGRVRFHDNVSNSAITGAEATLSNLNSAYWRFVVALDMFSSTSRVAFHAGKIGDQGEWVGFTPKELSASVTPVITTHQILRFGNLGAGVTSYWRDFAFRGDDALNQMSWTNPDDLRGRVPSATRVYVSNDTWVRWGGGGGFKGDTFEAELQYRTGFQALFHHSSQMGFRAATVAQQVWTFDADVDDGAGRFRHDAFYWQGNVGEVVVKYNSSDSWATPAAVVTVSAVLFVGATVSTTDGNWLQLHNYTWRAGEAIGKCLQVTKTGDPYYRRLARITHQSGNLVQLGDLGAVASAAGFGAGTTVQIVGDRGGAVYPSAYQYRYMQIQVPGVTTADTYAHVEVVHPGLTLSLSVPLEWSHDEQYTPGVVQEELTGGVRTSYESAPRRWSLAASVVGDVDEFRATLSALLYEVVGYENEPVVLVEDDGSIAESAHYCRYQGVFKLDHVAWYQDADDRWRKAGDVALVFDEEL